MAKISELGKVVVLFVYKDTIEHTICMEEHPNIATMKGFFEEIPEFISPEINIDELQLDILGINDYIALYGNIEVEDNHVIKPTA